MSRIANIHRLPHFVLLCALALISQLAAATTQVSYSSLASGMDHACVIQNLLINDKQSQNVLCWGHNDSGQLGSRTGDGNYVNSTPTAVVGLSGTVKQLAAGDGFTCALLTNGTVQCWGSGLFGRLGIEYWNIPSAQTWPSYGNTPVPQKIAIPPALNNGYGPGPVVQISAGGSFACAMTSGSANSPAAVYCWGDNRNDELGSTALEYSTSPIQISLPGPAGSLATGVDFACASGGIFNNLQYASVWCWGDDAHGELGDGATTLQGNHAAPSLVVGLPDRATIVQVTATDEGACALDSNGTGWCWGDDSDGEVGDGVIYPNLITTTPVQVPGGPYNAMWAGGNSWENCGTSTTGLYCTVGPGKLIARNTYFDPKFIFNVFTATPTDVSAGGAFVCAIAAVSTKTTGTTAQHVYCWGNDDYGQIGNGGAYGVGSTTPQLIL